MHTDKITRILFMFSKFIRGEKINKLTFCFETDIHQRSFDRDIEDVRLYLSEMFQNDDLLYDRQENVYYLSGSQRHELEIMEFQFLERILFDSKLLRKDEMLGLLCNLASNTARGQKITENIKSYIQNYSEPIHNKALLKMHGDLTSIIKNKSVIDMQYQKMNGEMIEQSIIPCLIKYDFGYLYLVGYKGDSSNEYPAYFRLDRIYSFKIKRSQYKDEKEKVSLYLKNYANGITQMYGGGFKEILVCCSLNYYSYVHDKFKNVEIVESDKNYFKLKIKAFEEGFVKWIISQPVEMIYILEPRSTIELLSLEAEKIINKYKNGGARNG